MATTDQARSAQTGHTTPDAGGLLLDQAATAPTLATVTRAHVHAWAGRHLPADTAREFTGWAYPELGEWASDRLTVQRLLELMAQAWRAWRPEA